MGVNARFTIIKRRPDYDTEILVNFVENTADYGGAIYVDDANSGNCASVTRTECFFQVLRVYSSYIPSYLEIQSIHIAQNRAHVSGSALYGGLLDRCAINYFSEVNSVYRQDYMDGGNGIMYFEHVS